MTLIKKIWEKVGYLAAYFALTFVIYFTLLFFNLLPSGWGILQIALLTSSITLFSILIRRIVK